MKHIFELRMKDQNRRKILAVTTQLKAIAKRKPEKNSGLNPFKSEFELDSSVGRALHWHRRGHGFECR